MTAQDLTTLSPDRLALATCALLAADRNERADGGDPRTVEEVLGRIGFTPGEVQAITGGNYKTIQSRINRAKK